MYDNELREVVHGSSVKAQQVQTLLSFSKVKLEKTE